MSGLPPKADMCGALAYIRFGPISDIALAASFTKKGPLRGDLSEIQFDA